MLDKHYNTSDTLTVLLECLLVINTKATIHDMNTVWYLQLLLLGTMLHIPSGNLRLTTVITLRLCYSVRTFLNG